MPYGLLADFVLVFHMAFILFVLFGGFLVMKWRPLVWVHIPSSVWGMSTEFFGLWCPLTPLENWFRQQSGRMGYETSFIEHYILPIVYPVGLTRELQVILGSAVLLMNGVIYGVIVRDALRRHERR
jgi:hypothetical protein